MSHNGADEQRLRDTLAGIKKTLVVLSGKGGVGKSTVAVNIAAGLAMKGFSTGLLDSDLHGPSVAKMLGMEEVSTRGDDTHIQPVETFDGRLKVMSVQFLLRAMHDSVIWRGPLKHAVISQLIGHTVWGDIDFLVVDSPPGTGDEPLSVVQTAHPDGAIIVTSPQDVATFDVRKSIDFCAKLDLPIVGIIENMSGFVCPACNTITNIFGSDGGKNMAEELGIAFLGKIPIDPHFVSISDAGAVYVEDSRDSAAKDVILKIVDSLVESTTNA
ncbi:MAG: P-loop NTPase [Chitinivibrionales bacterium]